MLARGIAAVLPMRMCMIFERITGAARGCLSDG
jgi:hypothetical protein